MAARRNPAPSGPEAPAPASAEGEEELVQSSPDHAPPLPLDGDEDGAEGGGEGSSDPVVAAAPSGPEAPEGAKYFVAPRRSINTRSRDLLKPGEQIYPSDFFAGQARIDELVEAGILEKR